MERLSSSFGVGSNLTMHTVNTRFLLVSAGLVVIVGVGATLLHGIQLRRSAAILLDQGSQRIKAGRPQEAVGYLSRYTLLTPHNAEAQILLADTLAQTGNTNAAIKAYETALLRDASLHEARRRLVELSIAAERFSAAKQHLVEFLLPYTPNDGRVYYLLGLCHEGLGEYALAVQRFREAIERDPALIESYSRLAVVLRDKISA
jgi:Flp pilus assembly protein TadD